MGVADWAAGEAGAAGFFGGIGLAGMGLAGIGLAGPGFGPGLAAVAGLGLAGVGLGPGLAAAGPGFGPAGPGLAAGLPAAGLGAADFLAAGAAGDFSPAGASAPSKDSLSRRATGGSTVDDADLTNSPCSFSRARTSLLVTPSSFANSWTRALPATALLTGEVERARPHDLGLCAMTVHRRYFTVCSLLRPVLLVGPARALGVRPDRSSPLPVRGCGSVRRPFTALPAAPTAARCRSVRRPAALCRRPACASPAPHTPRWGAPRRPAREAHVAGPGPACVPAGLAAGRPCGADRCPVRVCDIPHTSVPAVPGAWSAGRRQPHIGPSS